MTNFVERAILAELDDADVSIGYLLYSESAEMGALSFNESSGNNGLLLINATEQTEITTNYGICAELVV